MKKKMKHITLTLLMLVLGIGAQAQIYVAEGEDNELRNVTGENGLWNNTIIHGSENDQTNWTPVGDGILLLAALGGAYLLRQKKTNK